LVTPARARWRNATWIAVTLSVLPSACTCLDYGAVMTRLRRLRVGMSEQQMRDLLGPPTSMESYDSETSFAEYQIKRFRMNGIEMVMSVLVGLKRSSNGFSVDCWCSGVFRDDIFDD